MGKGRATRRGASYLRRAQRPDGGFALGEGGPTNSQSTAWAIQGLIAAGANPAAVRTNGRSPFDYLSSRQAGDGHYRYSSSSDQTPVWVTGQALLAVNRKPFPLAAVPRAPTDGRSAPRSGVGPSSGGGGSGSSGNRGTATGPQVASGGGPGEPGGAPRPPSGVAGELASGETVGAPVAADAPSSDHGASRTTAYVVGGFGALIAALTAGFFWYRRRLP